MCVIVQCGTQKSGGEPPHSKEDRMKRRDFLVRSAGFATMAVFSRGAANGSPKGAKLMNSKEFHASRKFAELSYGRIAYVERGQGPAAVFLHGYPLNGFQWRGALDRLSKYRRCIAPDFMGLGYSETPAEQSLAPEAQADMLAALFTALKIDAADIVANDSGGAVAQLFAAHHAAHVRSLLLTNCDVDENSPPPSFKPFLEAARTGALAEGLAQQVADKALARAPQGLGGIAYTDPANLTDEAIDCYLCPLVSSAARKAQTNGCALALEANPLVPVRAKLKRCAAPARIVWGTGDPIFDVSWADWLDRTLPKSRGVRRVEGAKLFFPEEMPEVIAEEAMGLWGVSRGHAA
jgi:haloalkane dehalogenase